MRTASGAKVPPRVQGYGPEVARPARLPSGGHVTELLHDRLRLLQPALDPRVHPAVGVIFRVDPVPAPDLRGDLPVRPALGLALQRQQKLVIPVPRTRPRRGARTPDQTSSIRSTSRTSSNPPSAGNASPPGMRIWAAAPFSSILSNRAPSPSRSPESDALPSAASAASGGAPGATMPSDISARAQKGAIGPSAA